MAKPRTFGELKASGYKPRTVKEELRANLRRALAREENPFEGIHGYDSTVLPALHNAILSRHDLLLLGLRGQAKTRLLRMLINLLDPEIPAIQGSELNEDPFSPISKYGRRILSEKGDDTPITWIPREERYREKLATPDVTIADLIGDIDPIKAATERRSYSDEEVIHFGIIPRTNRGIFAINELPDLQPRIQVGLLNILEERDLQIRGFPVRIPLDVLLVFSANPEDYTNRGNIITPLKDRISSQILTHYPDDVKTAAKITAQEAWIEREEAEPRVEIPDFFRELIEEIAFAARTSEFVDQSSGVSARMPISAIEILVSNLERRGLRQAEQRVAPRLCDLPTCLPAITGKVEMVYEGEQQGAEVIAKRLIGTAVKKLFDAKFPAPDSGRATQRKREEPEEGLEDLGPVRRVRSAPAPEKVHPLYEPIVEWFSSGNRITISDDTPFAEHLAALDSVPGLRKAVEERFSPASPEELAVGMELVLEGLTQHLKIAREDLDSKVSYTEMLKFNLVKSRTN
ncbi:MAG: AAA family ATPase [Thermoanaerobaculia bacterium]